MPAKPRLELTWIGKENRPCLEPRTLLHDPENSYHAKHRVSEKDTFRMRPSPSASGATMTTASKWRTSPPRLRRRRRSPTSSEARYERR